MCAVLKVRDVDQKTAGIVPHDIENKEFGQLTLYDFAGQKEFYAGHDAVLRSAVSGSSAAIFLALFLGQLHVLVSSLVPGNTCNYDLLSLFWRVRDGLTRTDQLEFCWKHLGRCSNKLQSLEAQLPKDQVIVSDPLTPDSLVPGNTCSF